MYFYCVTTHTGKLYVGSCVLQSESSVVTQAIRNPEKIYFQAELAPIN